MMKVLLALACAGALLLFAPAAAAQVTIDDPALEFRGHVVHATSLRPGAQVLLFGVARDHDGYNAVIRRWSEVLTDSDHDGQVELDLGSNVPFQSIFAVVDLNDGHYTVASPTGFGAIPPKRAKTLRRGPRALVDRMTSPGPMADAVYVQPGAGAWEVTAPTTSFVDGSRIAGRTYVYRVRAMDASGGSLSAYSNTDLATMMTFTAVQAGGAVSFPAHNELLTGLNALRGANGWAPLTWAELMSIRYPAPVVGGALLSEQLTFLRSRVNEALSALGVPTASYTDPDVKHGAVKALHIQQLQQRMQ
jgi:hypothetical protein